MTFYFFEDTVFCVVENSDNQELREINEEYFFAHRERIEWERYCWTLNEYTAVMVCVLLAVRLIHRKILFSLSGWLGRAGKKKRDGK